MGVMRVLDETGDTVVSWCEADEQSVDSAREAFARLTREAKIPFARSAGGDVHCIERINSFDPRLDEILWVRPIAGG